MIGFVLALAVFCAKFEELPASLSASSTVTHPTNICKSDEDGRIQKSMHLQHYETACDGLCVSNEVKTAGNFLLYPHIYLSEIANIVKETSSLDLAFGKRVDFKSLPSYECACQFLCESTGGERGPHFDAYPNLPGQLFALHLAVWEILQLSKRLNHVSNDVVVRMLRSSPDLQSSACSDFVETALQWFQTVEMVALTGRSLCEIQAVPPPRRGDVLSRVTMLCILRNFCDDLNVGSALEDYLQEDCCGLLDEMDEIIKSAHPNADKFIAKHSLKAVQSNRKRFKK
jgi:hypothetical protein